MSDEHFTVDGSLIETWASQNSVQRKDGDPGTNFRAQTRTNDTHASTTDPATNSIGNPTGRVAIGVFGSPAHREPSRVSSSTPWATQADGWAERDAGLLMLTRNGNARRGDAERSGRIRRTTCGNSSTSRANWAARRMSRRV